MNSLLESLRSLRSQAVEFAVQFGELDEMSPEHRASALNFLHYLFIRQFDLRPLQRQLREQGLASLGGIEGHVLDTLNHVILALERLMGVVENDAPEAPVSFSDSLPLLLSRSTEIFGPRNTGRNGRIMVTMPTSAAHDTKFIINLLEAGMNVMRINCAHDDSQTWLEMVQNLKKAEARTGKTCRIQADLAGPKLRTGNIGSLGPVLKVRPRRDFLGRVLNTAKIALVSEGRSIRALGIPCLELSGFDLDECQSGDVIRVVDARDAKRTLKVTSIKQGVVYVESSQTIYFTEGTTLLVTRKARVLGSAQAVHVPMASASIDLDIDDRMVLLRDNVNGFSGSRDNNGQQIEIPRVHCTLPEAFDVARPGESVWLDDGKIGAIILENSHEEMLIKVTQVPPGGAKLRSEKGINFPDSNILSHSLTKKDIGDLAVLADHVDMVALSFVRSPQDVAELQIQLDKLGAENTGIVLKIESRTAFESLPFILLEALKSPRVAVMIARGDLAVEVGFERLSEVQEEILWLCEAAHLPVIWATQILEGLAKKGAPSRAEVTDAAMSIRAECTMLNKGPNIVDAVAFLDGILRRMSGHYQKRDIALRRLNVCDHIRFDATN